MRRYFLPPSSVSEDKVIIQGESFHHIFDVCRQELGSQFEVLTGEQKAYFVKITQVGKKQALGQVLSTRPLAALPKPHIHLVLSFPKISTFESVLEKAVEMGVKEVHPVVSDFSFFKKAENIPAGKWGRFEKIVLQATQQTGRGEVMKVAKPLSLHEQLKTINQSASVLCLFAYEGESTLSLSEFVNRHKNQGLEEIYLIVGSEGGFSTSEVSFLKDLGLHPVTLGEQVLRVETACMSLLSILKYEFVKP